MTTEEAEFSGHLIMKQLEEAVKQEFKYGNDTE